MQANKKQCAKAGPRCGIALTSDLSGPSTARHSNGKCVCTALHCDLQLVYNRSLGVIGFQFTQVRVCRGLLNCPVLSAQAPDSPCKGEHWSWENLRWGVQGRSALKESEEDASLGVCENGVGYRVGLALIDMHPIGECGICGIFYTRQLSREAVSTAAPLLHCCSRCECRRKPCLTTAMLTANQTPCIALAQNPQQCH